MAPTGRGEPVGRGKSTWWLGRKAAIMYDSVLVPTDGSQEMSAVVGQAIDLATMSGATLHVLHVIDERAYYSVPDEAREQVRDTLRADAESFTKSVTDRALEAGLEVVREVRWGDPAPAILSYAVEEGVELVVLGTHGRTGYERYLLGSVAEKVVRMAPMPVLTIAVGDTDEQRRAISTTATAEPRVPDVGRPGSEADDSDAGGSEEPGPH